MSRFPLFFAAKEKGRIAANRNHAPGVTDMATVSKIKPEPQVQAGSVHWFDQCVARGQSGAFSEVTMVTPGLASVILSRNDNNRHIKPVKAGHYASDMLSGRWVFNGEPIIIAETGELNDGQHRLQALIDANISLPFMIVFGISRESRKTVDQGAARTAADYLSMDGVKNAATSAGVARLVMAFEKLDGRGVGCAKDFTNSDVVARVHADQQIVASATYAQDVARFAKGLLIPSMIGTCHYVLTEIHPGDTVEYLNQVCIGENIKRGDPAFAVRAALTSYERTGKSPRMEMVLRGWNAFRQGRKLTLAKTLGTFPALV